MTPATKPSCGGGRLSLGLVEPHEVRQVGGQHREPARVQRRDQSGGEREGEGDLHHRPRSTDQVFVDQVLQLLLAEDARVTMHGGHHEAQKFTTSGSPANASSEVDSPSKVSKGWSLTSGPASGSAAALGPSPSPAQAASASTAVRPSSKERRQDVVAPQPRSFTR